MGSKAKYAGDTPLALDALETDLRQTIVKEWATADVQRMQELEGKLAHINARRGILKRKAGRAEP